MLKSKEIILIVIFACFLNFIFSKDFFTLKPLLPSSLNYIDLIDLDNQLLALQVSMGYPPQKFVLLFDINSDYTWVRGSGCLQCSYSKVFQENDSQTLFKTNITKSWQDLNQNIKGEIVYDYINVKIFSASNMPFLIVEEDYYLDGVDGVIGFGYGKNSEINFSILDKFRENNQIETKIFSFKFNEDISPSLFLGGLPPHIVESNLSYCNVNTTLSSWNCRISHIFVGTDVNFYKSVQLNVDAIFSTINNNILVPNKYIQFFFQNYFEHYPNYESKFCYVKPDGKKSYILCNLKYFDINKAPVFSLIINGYAYKIQPHLLFEQLFSDAYNQFYFFKIVFMESNDWILGSSFLKQFELVFNKETNQVGFYGGDKYDLTKFTRDRSESTCLYNYFVFIFIFFLIAFSMGYMYYKKKQEQKVLYFRSFSESYKKKTTKEEKEIKLINN
jgi:hypothetical protein